MAKRKRLPNYAQPSAPAPVSSTPVEHGGRLRRLIAEATDAEADPLLRLTASRGAREVLELVEGVAWRDARLEGLSWLDLAEVVGVTRSGAQQRAAALLARLDAAE